MGEAKRNRETLLLFNVERRLAGEPVCTCPQNWFNRQIRLQARMTQGGPWLHTKECDMGFEQELKRRERRG